jgi:hypothetical protein
MNKVPGYGGGLAPMQANVRSIVKADISRAVLVVAWLRLPCPAKPVLGVQGLAPNAWRKRSAQASGRRSRP